MFTGMRLRKEQNKGNKERGKNNTKNILPYGLKTKLKQETAHNVKLNSK